MASMNQNMGNKLSELIDSRNSSTTNGEQENDDMDNVDHHIVTDEVDRPRHNVSKEIRKFPQDMSNRPPVAMDESEEFDEVDRSSHDIDMAPGENGTDKVDKRPSGNIIERQESEMLPSILPVPEDKKPRLEEPVEEMLNTIDIEYDKEKFVLEELPTLDDVDGKPSGDTEAEDGPGFISLFRPNPQQEIFVQHRAERTNKEGITTKHTTYFPKPLDKNKKQTPGNSFSQLYSDSFYDMDFFPRGRATIINVKYFKRSSGMADCPREGTNRDADGLTNVFLDLGFVVERFDNPSKREIMAIVASAAKEDYSDKGCTACAILSHGEEGIIYGTDESVQIKEITKAFRSRSLAGKPKFFLIQACQGSEYMDPVDKVDGPASQKLAKKEEQEMALALPSEADFLYAYSTVPGYYSWRNSRRGSWFMEALVKVFRENSHKMDVMRMLVKANDIVSSRKSRTDEYRTDNKRQIASIVNQMRKDFFFFPPYGPLPCK